MLCGCGAEVACAPDADAITSCNSCIHCEQAKSYIVRYFAGGFPQKSAVSFSWSLILVAAGIVLFTCGGTVYPKSSPEDRYRVIRWGK